MVPLILVPNASLSGSHEESSRSQISLVDAKVNAATWCIEFVIFSKNLAVCGLSTTLTVSVNKC